MVLTQGNRSVRVVQLTYNIANHLGASCWEPNDGGLTRAGHRMVAALNGAGVLILVAEAALDEVC